MLLVASDNMRRLGMEQNMYLGGFSTHLNCKNESRGLQLVHYDGKLTQMSYSTPMMCMGFGGPFTFHPWEYKM